ncbi:helix-turn-helix domain-containing protein [Candidatus Dehalogenimonas loeffleri]|uniref:helix-turn-helix domain-containing protein n=1 Tax=Candidatus Dehalogenimonas loeffleri TaxID=3127115 RepID=UPI0035C89F4F
MPRKKVEKADKELDRVYLTFTEAQRCLGVSHDTMYKLMKQGLPSHKIGRKRVFLQEELIQWIKEH